MSLTDKNIFCLPSADTGCALPKAGAWKWNHRNAD